MLSYTIEGDSVHRLYQRRVFFAYPRFDVAPELLGQRQHVGGFLIGHRQRLVVRNPVALAAERIELAHERRVGPDGVFQRLNGFCVMPGNIRIRAIPEACKAADAVERAAL